VDTPQQTPEQIADNNEFYKLYNESRAWTLRIVILNRYPDLGADQTELAAGTGCEVQIGQQSIEKNWVSMTAVREAAGGPEAFEGIATVDFKALAGIIGNTAAAALQTEERTGYRKVTAVAVISVPCERVLSAGLPRAA
jgi:hypothetical protein